MLHTMKRGMRSVSGVDLHWAEMGDGPPLVLLHGLTDSHRTWFRVAPELARTHRVLMPDLAGHGLSSRPDASYELSWHAKIVADWLDSLGVEPADVIGHSFGGGVAQWLLLERRARVRRLGLVSAGGLGREVSFSLRLAAIPGVVEAFGQPFMGVGTHIALRTLGAAYARHEIAELSWMNAQPGSARALARTVRDVIDMRGQRRHFFERAHEVAELPPIGVFWGAGDPVIPMAHAGSLMERVEGAQFTQFEGCGHFPHREQPDAFVAALRRFVDDPETRPVRLRRVHSVTAPLSRRRSWAGRALGAVAAYFRGAWKRSQLRGPGGEARSAVRGRLPAPVR